MTDPYVEQVWSEFLGPTATLLARRLGRSVELRPGGQQVEVADLAASVGVAPGVAVRALARLNRFEVVHSDLDRGVIGVSGYAPPVGDERLFRLSEAGRTSHDRFMADLDARHVSPGRAAEMFAATPAVGIDRGLVPLAIR
ncbi:MAG: hypothetical protein ACE37B_11215 [Ilumatobacter sp.]|uniref:hypothetical protein n=1 Tax=Ilumatobacter sp. TaxID=1967498 RepID=UPI00391D0A7E